MISLSEVEINLTVVIIVWALSNLPLGVEPGSKDSILGTIYGVSGEGEALLTAIQYIS